MKQLIRPTGRVPVVREEFPIALEVVQRLVSDDASSLGTSPLLLAIDEEADEHVSRNFHERRVDSELVQNRREQNATVSTVGLFIANDLIKNASVDAEDRVRVRVLEWFKAIEDRLPRWCAHQRHTNL